MQLAVVNLSTKVRNLAVKALIIPDNRTEHISIDRQYVFVNDVLVQTIGKFRRNLRR